MPILPNEIKRRIDRKPPDRVGEEGILHVVEQAHQRYYAKQWYGQAADKKRFTDPNEGRSPASPYWAKLKYYEGKLVHAAFPDLAIELVAAYDERITKNEQGQYEFRYRSGRPLTLSKEVAGDPALMRMRDAILQPAYDHMLKYHKQTQHGTYATQPERAEFYRVVAEADIQLAPLLGKDNLQYTLSHTHEGSNVVYINPDTIHQAIAHGLIHDDGGKLVQMLHYGIMPLHPEFNFIPENRTPTGQVHGKYVELMIVNPAQFFQQWKQDHPRSASEQAWQKPDVIVGAFDRYRLFVTLDDLFDRLIYRRYQHNQPSVDNQAVSSRLYRITEALRVQCAQHGFAVMEHLYNPIVEAVEQTLNSSHSPAEVISHLEHIQNRLAHYQP